MYDSNIGATGFKGCIFYLVGSISYFYHILGFF